MKYTDPSGHIPEIDDGDIQELIESGKIGNTYYQAEKGETENPHLQQDEFLITGEVWPQYSLLLDRRITLAERNYDLLKIGSDVLGIFIGGVLGGIAGVAVTSPSGPGAAAGGVAGAVAGGIAGYAVGEGLALNVPGGGFDIYEMEDIVFWFESEVNDLEDSDYLLVSFEYQASNDEYSICLNSTNCQNTSRFAYEQILGGFHQAYEELK